MRWLSPNPGATPEISGVEQEADPVGIQLGNEDVRGPCPFNLPERPRR